MEKKIKKPVDGHLTIEEIENLIEEHRLRKKIDRRSLLSSCAKITGGLLLLDLISSGAPFTYADVEWTKSEKQSDSGNNKRKGIKTTIVQVTNKNSTDSTGEGKSGEVNEMISKAILELTGEKDLKSAWRIIAKEGTRVGIKVNCIAGRGLSTQVPVVMAIVEGLKKANVRERDIIIWDRTSRELERADYPINENTDSLRCFGTDKIGYQKERQEINGTGFRLSKILVDEIDVLINIPVMKNHGGAGITLAMKNHYGSHDNPGEHHTAYCDPDIANINAHKIIRSKTKLIVVDALRAQCQGGPSDKPKWKWNPGMILMGFDPVAIDRTGSEIIEARRLETGVASLGNSHRHIATAAKLGLGTDNLKEIDVKKFDMKV